MNASSLGKLIIARHHESEWNKLGKWTGSRDVHLTEYGFKMSERMGALIRDIHIDRAFASAQIRSFETLLGMEEGMLEFKVPVEFSAAINERDYGDYTGLNKWEVEQKIGKEKFDDIRRCWDCPVPNGETLKMVYARAVPFYLEHIVPALAGGTNVLVVSHGNAIRAMMKYIEHISDDDVKHLEMLFGAVVIYQVDGEGHMISKEIRETKSTVNA